MHFLRVQIDRNEVNIKLGVAGMELRTSCEFELVERKSVSN
jgi:hypothetical protein